MPASETPKKAKPKAAKAASKAKVSTTEAKVASVATKSAKAKTTKAAATKANKAAATKATKASATKKTKAAKTKASKSETKKLTSKDSTLRIRLRSFDYRQLDAATEIIVRTVHQSGGIVCGPIPLPTTKTRFDLLRSPHVDKDSREQVEIRTYHRLVDIPNPSKKTSDPLLALDLPFGVLFNMKEIRG